MHREFYCFGIYKLDLKLNRLLTRSMRIDHALNIIQYRFKNIKSFEPMTKLNVTFGDDTLAVDLNGYRIVLNHSSSILSSFYSYNTLLINCLLIKILLFLISIY